MPQRIVYLSWPANEISGGIKMAFRHVEVLREAGFDAVIATEDAKRPQWFETTAPLIGLSGATREDVLVFPENHNPLLKTFAPWSNRKVVFCQNWSMAIRGLGECRSFSDFGVSRVLCVDPYTARYCEMRFPTLPVGIVPVYIDRRRFCVENQKKVQIAYSPSKRRTEAVFIQDLFQTAHPEFRDIPWIQFQGMSESQLATKLRESAIFLSLCRLESCPLTILEALACGCVTAGFTGIGGRQFTTTRNGFWAEEDDCIHCADQLAAAVRLVNVGGARCSDMLEAAQHTAEGFARERMTRGLVEFWRGFFAQGGEA